jgi:hypothetical protein
MTFDWQNLVVLAIVAAAAMYIARVGWTSLVARKTTACGGCRNCASREKSGDVFSITSSPATDAKTR